MLRLAVLIWILVGTVLAGVFVTVVIATPALAADVFRLVLVAGIGGYVLAIPVAYLVTRRLMGPPPARSS